VFFKDLVHYHGGCGFELSGMQSPGEGCKALEKHHGKWHQWDSQVLSMAAHVNDGRK